MTYSEWFRAQTPERQDKAIQHSMNARDCGIAQRAGDWAEADRLTALIRDYYLEDTP